MKGMILKCWLLVLLLMSFSMGAQNVFENGNAAYRRGDFAAAAQAYESILASKKESAGLYFNLGNAYYKMNKVAPAIYNYEKALLLDPGNQDVKNNLKFAQKLQIDEVKEVPKVGFGKLVEDYTSSLSVNGWAWFAVVSAFLILAGFCGYYFSGSTLVKRIFFIFMGVCLLSMFVGLFAAYFEKSRKDQQRPAIVFAGVASIKSEPQQNAPDASVLHEGSKVEVVEELDDWRKVTIQDGNQGWIKSSEIREIK